MKKIFFILVLLCFAHPASATVADSSLTTVLPELIASGGSKIMENIGNQLYAMAGIENASQAQTKISDYMVAKNDFVKGEGVQKNKDFNAFWYLVVYILFAGYGAARLAAEKGKIAQGFAAHKSYGGTYLKFLVMGLLFFLFYLYGLQWLSDFEWLLAKGIVVQSVNIIPLTPQNGISYLIIAIANIVVWLFMLLRYIIVYVVIMYLLWILCMTRIPVVGIIAYGVLVYGAAMFFFRVFIAFIFMAGASAIESAHLGGLVLPYLALMILIIYICYYFMIVPAIYIHRKIGSDNNSRSGTHIHNHYGSNGSNSYQNEEILHE